MFMLKRLMLTGLALSCAALVLAAGPKKPTIDDLAGTWDMKAIATAYRLSTGKKGVGAGKLTWVITKVSDTVVSIHQTGKDPADQKDFTAYYANGLLYRGAADDPNLATKAACAFGEVRGVGRGRLVIIGSFTEYDNSPSEDFLRSGTWMAKQRKPTG